MDWGEYKVSHGSRGVIDQKRLTLGEDTTLGDNDVAEQAVQFLVVL